MGGAGALMVLVRADVEGGGGAALAVAAQVVQGGGGEGGEGEGDGGEAAEPPLPSMRPGSAAAALVGAPAVHVMVI